jgi:hypothetical protein
MPLADRGVLKSALYLFTVIAKELESPRRKSSTAGDDPTISYFTLRTPHQRSRCLRTRSDIATERLYIPINKQLSISFCSVRGAVPEATHDTIPDKYVSSGGPSSVGVISNAASIPTIVNHMLARAKERPGHRRAPKPNAWFGKVGAPGESQRSGLNRSGSGKTAGSCIIPLGIIISYVSS